MNFKLTFKLDGTGVYVDKYDPIHLDSLLCWSLAPTQTKQVPMQRDDIPFDVKLPLKMGKLNGQEVWNASALFFGDECPETLRFWRKKFRQNCVEIAKGTANLQHGPYREYNMPVPLTLAKEAYCYASGDRGECLKILRKNIKSIGKKRAYGYGKIIGIEAEKIDQDYSWVKYGVAMRYYPHPNGDRLIRPRPPYWNIHERCKCFGVGIEIPNNTQLVLF